MRKYLFIAAACIILLILVSPVVVFLLLNTPMPQGNHSSKADEIAKRIQEATGYATWQNIGAVKFTVDEARSYLWDRKRQFVRVQFHEDDDVEVILDLTKNQARVLQDKKLLPQDKSQDFAERALHFFNNDSFWFYPFERFFYPDVQRFMATVKSEEGLLVKHATSAWQPKDAFLWSYDAQTFVPYGFKTWTVGTRIGGMWMTFENWQTFSGVKIATLHRTFLFNIRIKDIALALDLNSLEKNDPFTMFIGDNK